MNDSFAIRRIFGQTPVKISCSALADDSGVTNRISSAKAGVRRYDVTFPDGSTSFVGKRKSRLIVSNGIKMLSGTDICLFIQLIKAHKLYGYNSSAIREAALYRGIDPSLKRFLPDIKGTAVNTSGGECFIAMEILPQHSNFSGRLYEALDTIALFHARYLDDESSVEKLKLNNYTSADYKRTRGSLARIFRNLSKENTAAFGKSRCSVIEHFINNIHEEFSRVETRRTLTHNDLCDRNICATDDRLCIYDWELACYQNPEHDAMELVISVMDRLSDAEAKDALHHYRKTMEELTGNVLSDERYSELLRFNTLEYCVNKLSMLRRAGIYLGLDYTEKLAENTARMMDILEIG